MDELGRAAAPRVDERGEAAGRSRRSVPAQRWQDLGHFVRDRRSASQLSLRRLSQLSGISNPYLSQIERGLRRPSAEILRQLAAALDLPPEDLYVRAGILEHRAGGSDVATAIRHDPDLTESQKRTLAHVYEALRAEAACRRAPAST